MKKENVMRLTNKEKELIEMLRDKEVRYLVQDILLGEIVKNEKDLTKYSGYKDSLIYSEAERKLPLLKNVRNLIKS